jgi:hypothetical protein
VARGRLDLAAGQRATDIRSTADWGTFPLSPQSPLGEGGWGGGNSIRGGITDHCDRNFSQDAADR